MRRLFLLLCTVTVSLWANAQNDGSMLWLASSPQTHCKVVGGTENSPTIDIARKELTEGCLAKEVALVVDPSLQLGDGYKVTESTITASTDVGILYGAYERMCKNMQKDRAKHNTLPLSKFGLMQITRQRVRPVMEVNVEETCPTCFGTGKIKSSILFTDQLERKIDFLVNKIGIKRFTLYVNPYVSAFINEGIFSLKRRWQFKYGFGIHVVASQKLAFLQYEFYDKNNEFIDMQEEQEKM